MDVVGESPQATAETITCGLLESALLHYHDLHQLALSPLAADLHDQHQTVRSRPTGPEGSGSGSAAGQALQAALDAHIDALRKQPGEAGQAGQLLDAVFRQRLPPQAVYRDRLHISKTHFYRQRRRALLLLTAAWEASQGAAAPQPWESRLPPPSYTRLFGAQTLIDQALQALADPAGPPLVVLDGLGGLGKTAAGRETAHQALSGGLFQDVIWQTAVRTRFTWGEVRCLDQPALTADSLLNGLAEALGAPEWIPLPETLKVKAACERLAQQPSLLVVDNLETAADVHAILGLLRRLAAAGRVRILITSRHQLDDLGPARACHLRPLAQADALAFIRYHAAEQGQVDLSRAGEPTLAEIHAATQGHPLAIKLVIGQLGVLPLDQAIHSLQALERSSDPFYTFIYRHSWSLLSRLGRETLLSLPHLAPEGAAWDELLAVSGLEPDDLNHGLGELVRFSLVNADGGLEKHYSLHPLTRQFILAELAGRRRLADG